MRTLPKISISLLLGAQLFAATPASQWSAGKMLREAFGTLFEPQRTLFVGTNTSGSGNTGGPAPTLKLVSHTSATASGSLTTPGIDTTGATLLICVTVNYQHDSSLDSVYDFVDGQSNVWNHLSRWQSPNGDANVAIHYSWYKTSPGSGLNAGPGHQVTSGASYPAGFFAAFSGTSTVSDPFDRQNGGGANSATTQATGSITPGAANYLLITALGHTYTNSGLSIDSPFTLIDQFPGSVAMAGGIAWTVGSAGPANPAWNKGAGAVAMAAAIASFRSAP